jgi:hypothetical protein
VLFSRLFVWSIYYDTFPESKVDTHFSIADADEHLLNLLQQYKKDVGEYKALRSVGEQTMFSTEKSDDEWWHQALFDAIKERMDQLEQEYRELTGGTSK